MQRISVLIPAVCLAALLMAQAASAQMFTEMINRAIEQQKAGKYQEAIRTWSNALGDRVFQPGQATRAYVHVNRGVCYYKLKQFKSALHDCDMALKIAPTYDRAHYFRSRILVTMARESLAKVVQHTKNANLKKRARAIVAQFDKILGTRGDK